MTGGAGWHRFTPRVVPPVDVPQVTVEEAAGLVRDAWPAVKAAQARLVSRLALTERLADTVGRPVRYAELRSMRAQALEQVQHAQAVVDALTACVEALERAVPPQDRRG